MISLNCVDVIKPKFVKSRQLKTFLNSLISAEGFSTGDVAIVFCSDEYLLKVNQDFLNHDYYTDIITFDYCENGKISGDLLISLDRVLDNSTKEKTIFKKKKATQHNSRTPLVGAATPVESFSTWGDSKPGHPSGSF